MKKSNALKYTAQKTVGDEVIIAKIRLDDECKNGHQDFSITGDIYVAGKQRTDKNHIAGGCIHDEILKHFPEFEIFINLHLCDYKGIPMHAVANGFYHLQNGFEGTPPTKFKEKYCKYYRVSSYQFHELSKSESQLQFALNLQRVGVLRRWEKEANEAIKILEGLTGEEFLVDSKRTQYEPPTKEEIEEEQKRIDEGYYNYEAKVDREVKAIQDKIDDLEKALNDRIEKDRTRFDIQKQLLLLGDSRYKQGCIYYDHIKTLKFNWSSTKLTNEEIHHIRENLILPEGGKFEPFEI